MTPFDLQMTPFDPIIWPQMTPYDDHIWPSSTLNLRLTSDDSIVVIYSKQFIVIDTFLVLVIQCCCDRIVCRYLKVFVIATFSFSRPENWLMRRRNGRRIREQYFKMFLSCTCPDCTIWNPLWLLWGFQNTLYVVTFSHLRSCDH